MKNITIVVRSVNERTSEKCVEYLNSIFGKENVFLVKNEIPFSTAVKKTFEIGIRRNKKWTLAIDADVFLFKDKIKDFIFEAEKFVSKQKKVYCLEGKLFDKFSQTYREVGCHLYYTKYLKKALKYVAGGKDTVRPETYVKEKMAQKGFGFYVNRMPIGIHDFFQNPQNIIKKSILHSKKHENISSWIEIWKKEAQNDNDFVYALKGNEIYNSLDDKTIFVNSDFMDKLLSQFNIELEQKNILTNCEIDSVLTKYNQNICEDEDKKFEIIFPVKANKTIKDMIFSKEKIKDKRIIYCLGVKFSYKKKSKNSFLNSFLKNIKPYKTASHKIWTLNKDDRSKTLKLDWNEATIPPSPKVISRLKELVELGDFYNLYPATENKKIIDLLSEYTGLKEDNLQYFASSDSIHEYITKAFIGVGDNVIIQAPSYDNFRLTAQANGANIIFSEIDSDFKFNPKKFEKDIDKYKPVFIYISNPNNPVGYVHETEYIEHLLKKYKNIMFLIDEAYFEFSGITSSSLVTKYQNILITRTLSKAFAIANFRFGYLISSKENIDNISKIRNPKNITTLTQEAAICALSDIDYMKKYVGEVNSAKEYFINELAKKYSAFIKVYKSHSNFVVLKFQNYEMKMDFYDYLKNNFIYVRILSQSPLLNTSLRITVGTLSQMKRVLEVIDNFFRNKNKKNNIDKNDKIALFDFCLTVVDFSTADEFVNFVRKKKRLPIMKIKNNFRKLFNILHLTKIIQQYTDKHVHKLLYLSQLKGLSRSEIELFAKDYYENCIKPRFVKETIEEIYKLKKLGYKLYVVSGGYDVYLKYFIKEFNFDGLICTKIDFKNDKVTGNFDGYDCLNFNKIILLKRYFNKENLKNYNSVAYSDSITDLPLLNYCKKGVVVSKTGSEKWVKENNFEEIIW